MRPFAVMLTLLAACTTTSDPTDDSGDTGAAYTFSPYAGDPDPIDPTTSRLCDGWDDPEGVDDTTFIDCRIEGGTFAPDLPPLDGPLRIMVWNLERGQTITKQLAAWADGDLPIPDVLLASEVDRGCSRSEQRNVPRAVAEALGMDYAFGVEFVELPRGGGSGGTIDDTCEHGNAILSRYPMGNVRWAIHAENQSWYLPPDERDGGGEPRLGGRSYVQADLDLGEGRYLRTFTLHFENRPPPTTQQAQAAELADLADASPIPVALGGDTNSFGYTADVFSGGAATGDVVDLTIGPFVDAGLVDAHATLPAEDRATRTGVVIDLLLGRGVSWSNPVVCDAAVCDDLSDHRAVWADATWDGP